MMLDETYDEGKLRRVELVRGRWNPTAGEKQAILDRLDQIIGDPETDPRVRGEAVVAEGEAEKVPVGPGDPPGPCVKEMLMESSGGKVYRVTVGDDGRLSIVLLWSP